MIPITKFHRIAHLSPLSCRYVSYIWLIAECFVIKCEIKHEHKLYHLPNLSALLGCLDDLWLNIQFEGSGCGAVGRAVAFKTRGPRFGSSNRQNFIEHLFIINCIEKLKINKKEAGNGPLFNIQFEKCTIQLNLFSTLLAMWLNRQVFCGMLQSQFLEEYIGFDPEYWQQKCMENLV